jgi:predicted esterase
LTFALKPSEILTPRDKTGEAKIADIPAELGPTLAPGAAVLSVRGNVDEHGMSRFFRRLAEGVYDMADLAFRTRALDAGSDEIEALS